MKTETLQLTDLVELKSLQKIQNAFAQAFNMPSIIYDTTGTPVTQPSCFTEFCQFVRSTEKGNRNCIAFDASLIKQLSQSDKPLIRHGCVSQHIITATIPIRINNIHLANFGVGQLIDKDLDIEELKRYAAEIGVNSEVLIQKSKTLIPTNKEKLDRAVEFLSVLTEQICELGLKNFQNKQLLGKLEKIENEVSQEQMKLHESEQKFRLIAENTSDGIFVSNQNGEIIYISPAYSRLLGYSEKEELGRGAEGIYSLIHPNDRDELFATIYKAIEEKKTDITYTFRAKHKDGHYIWREDHAKFNYDTHNNHISTYVICRDVTEKKTQEHEIIKAKEKAEEGDRLKSAFLQNISHEIRTPMNAICGFSELLQNTNLAYEKQKHFIKIINKSVNQLLYIIENIITISHIETNQIKINLIEFNPNNLINELFDEYLQKQQSNGKINIDLKLSTSRQTNIKIKSDYTHLRQIFHILLDNAFKFTHTGTIEFGYSLNENNITFFVNDTGIGIPDDKQQIIFKSFAQADDTIRQLFGGMGLGLSIAVGLIKLIGGQLTIHSVENKGTEINFGLPVIKKDVVNEQATEPIAKNLNKLTLLVAEDEELNYLYIEELLLETGINILHASNGQQAVEMCKSKPVDVIIMDLKMPVLSGYEATAEIRKFNKTVPIIAQTAFAFKREDCLNSGFSDYIAKPFSDKQLINIIQHCVNN